MSYPIHKTNVSLYTTGVTCGAENAYPYGGLKFIHAFSDVLTCWYLQTFLPSDELEKQKS